MTWRYIATRLNGDGTETILDYDIPLTNVEIHTTLNGHGGLTGTLTPEFSHLKHIKFTPWTIAIYAEADGQIRGGGILETVTETPQTLNLDCIGHTGYLTDTRYTGIKTIERGDPLKTARHLWEHTQNRKGYNLGVTFHGATKSRQMFIGDDDADDITTTPQKVDPYILAWWTVHDLAKEFDALAELAPFEWTMKHTWQNQNIAHQLHFGYPRIGKRNKDIHLSVGTNVTNQPEFETTSHDYATQIFILGTGEGRTTIHHTETANTKGLQRDAVIIDKSLSTPRKARSRGQKEMALRAGVPSLSQVHVIPHAHAPLGSISVGDDVRLETAPNWTNQGEIWVRVMSVKVSPDDQTTTLEVMRSEKIDE